MDAFVESLLQVMDRKNHWAWPYFSGAKCTRDHLLVHYQQEWTVYVRDFPMMLGRVHGRCPVPEVRRELAENLFEEETGQLSKTGPHPELFLDMMGGLGFPRAAFERVRMLPEAAAYRAFLDYNLAEAPWLDAVAVLTIFVEGSVNDRASLEGTLAVRSPDEVIQSDMLVRHHGVDPAKLTLKRAHSAVEGAHRTSAWSMVRQHARVETDRARVVELVTQAFDLWTVYRDGVARACGLVRGG